MLLIPITMNRSAGARGKNIVLVEDDPSARQSIKLLLCIDRHTVTEAENGHEALQLFTGSTYDLVIMDYFMPGGARRRARAPHQAASSCAAHYHGDRLPREAR